MTKCTWFFNKGRPTWWHLLYYVNLLLNMFQMLIHPPSGVCYYLVRYCVGCIVLTWGVLVLCSVIGCWWCGIRVQAEPLNNAPSSRKLLKMDVLTSETCWAVNWHNKASVIKLVYHYSNIEMMHGPIPIRCTWFYLYVHPSICLISLPFFPFLFWPLFLMFVVLMPSTFFPRTAFLMCLSSYL